MADARRRDYKMSTDQMLEKTQLLERANTIMTAFKMMLHVMETHDVKWIVILARFAFSMYMAGKNHRACEIKRGIIAIVPDVHCKEYNPDCPCSIFYMLFCDKKVNNLGWKWIDMRTIGRYYIEDYGFFNAAAKFYSDDDIKSARQHLVDFGPSWNCMYGVCYSFERDCFIEGEDFPLVDIWKGERRRKIVLPIILLARRNCPASPFHSDALPLDMFKIIVALSGLMPWRGRIPPKLAALWETK